MADVYLAVARGPGNFSKLVVLKQPRMGLQADPESHLMFFDEARLAARLNHPNIVQTYEALEDDGIPTIVMEYLDGRPLSAIFRRATGAQRSIPVLLRVIAEALAGLQYAHDLVDFDGTALHVIHRDATPQNIFITFDGQVKVVDFGIAQRGAAANETRQGIIRGRMPYVAPERILGGPVDRRVDVYSVGVILWQIATGQPLWKGESEAVIANCVVRGAIPSPRSVLPTADPRLEQICMKALSRYPKDRYSTAAALAMAIETLLDDMGARVSKRDVASEMSRLFADVRADTKTLISRQISGALRLEGEASNLLRNSGEPSWGSLSSLAPPIAAPQSVPPQMPPSPPLPEDHLRRNLAFGAIALLLVGAAIAASVPSNGRRQRILSALPAHANVPQVFSAQPKARRPSDPGSEASAPTTQRVPQATRLSPVDEEVPPSQGDVGGGQGDDPRTIKYETTEKHVKASASPGEVRATSFGVAADSPPLPRRPDCSVPFFIDARGIKKMLPECI